MLMIISPAKTLDYAQSDYGFEPTQPQFLADAQALINDLKKLAPQDIASLMKVSDKIASLNYARFQEWSQPFNADNAKPCLLAFKGDVYTGLAAEDFDAEDYAYAQASLRILSGLYGVLRPLDLMQAYRLEMGTKYPTARGKNLYAFWGSRVTDALNAAVQEQAHKPAILLNLASQEYSKVVQMSAIQAQVITPVFKDKKNGVYKVISFHAKRARGMMARYVIQHRITDSTALHAFNAAGYYFSEADSTENAPVFLREP